MIATEVHTSARPATVHELLVDVDAWSVWSPHVVSVESPTKRVAPGWVGETRAFFSPLATPMVVDRVRPDGGYSWHSTLGPWRLDYDNEVVPTADGCALRFSASLRGPAATIVERLVARLSARGQRRRMNRLGRLAEVVERHAG